MKTLNPSRRSVASLRLVRSLIALVCFILPTSLLATTSSPVAVFPANNAVLKCPNASIVLLWNEVNGMNTYFIDVASDPEMKNHIYQKVVTFDTGLSIALLPTVHRYYWTVSTGIETTPIATFSTAFVSKVELSTLFHGAEQSSDLVHFAWKADEAASSYTFEYNLGAEIQFDTIILGTQADIVLPREQTIVWRVRSVCKTAIGEWSDRDTVRVAKLVSEVAANNAEGLFLYPQPAAALVRVDCDSEWRSSSTECRLRSLLGEEIRMEPRWTETGFVLNLQSIPAGVYHMQLHNGPHYTGCFIVHVD